MTPNHSINYFSLICFLSLVFNINLHSQNHPDIEFQAWLTGFNAPVGLEHAGDGTDRLFVVEQDGAIKVIENGVVLGTNFLTKGGLSGGFEQGLLGLAFHPDYANNGYFFINYTNSAGNTRISRYSVSSTNPNVADASSEQVIMSINQPYSNHNGGCINFGPDGYLYIGMGDGGSGGDPQGYGQNKQSLLGKMLRIDVDVANGYVIPPSNPFVGDGTTLDEIWALGMRNPWRFSFDILTGDMWIGDVGQNAIEEIDFQPGTSTGGENYGWRCYEGTASYNTSGCAGASAYVDPVFEYNHNFGSSIVGGEVYRGETYSCLQGFYFLGDTYDDNIWTVAPDGNGGWTSRLHTNISTNNLVSFDLDEAGELYAVGIGGTIYRVTGTSATLTNNPIPTNLYSESHSITSTGRVASGSAVDFEAGDFIELGNNFCVEAGADFDAYIDMCIPPSR